MNRTTDIFYPSAPIDLEILLHYHTRPGDVDNPDHGFHSPVEGDARGCPVCGSDPDHRVKNGGKCTDCDGLALTPKQPTHLAFWEFLLSLGL